MASQLDRAAASQTAGRLDEAVADYEAVLAADPGNAQAEYCLGLIDLRRQDIDQAHRRFSDLMARGHPHPRVQNALGVVALARGDYAQALEWHERALALDPAFPEAHVNRALMLLRAGRYPEGFAEFEWRWQVPGRWPAPRDPAGRLGPGRVAAGQTILVHAEQGLGDMIQFARYLPALRDQGLTVILEAQAELVGLLDDSGCADWVIAQGDPVPDHDVHCPIASLPFVLGTTVDSIPDTTPYLHTDPARDRQWQALLPRDDRPRVGLVWAGNPGNPTDAVRSISLAALEPLSRSGSVRWFSLQKGPQAAELAGSARWNAMTDLAPRLLDFRDTASALRQLDLVITVDTAVAHLAGALAVPAWLMIHKPCDWRWRETGERTPWYGSMRLYRQDSPGQWGPVVEAVATALAGLGSAA
jgi:hypothetical protein